MRPRDADAYLTLMLERAGLHVAHLDLWETWKVFKEFAKVPVESDGHGVCVHLVRDDGPEGKCVYLELLRQYTTIEEEESVPVWGTWIELVYEAEGAELATEVELWSYDFASFADFAAEVERLPAFQRAATRHVVESSVTGGEL